MRRNHFSFFFLTAIDGFGPLLYTSILDVMLKFQDVRRLQEMALEALSAMAVTARKLIDEEAEEDGGEEEKDDDKEKGSKRGKRENHGAYFIHKLNEAGAQRCVLTSMEKNLNSSGTSRIPFPNEKLLFFSLSSRAEERMPSTVPFARSYGKGAPYAFEQSCQCNTEGDGETQGQ